MDPIPVNLAVEDAVSEVVAHKLLQFVACGYATRTVYNRGGFGYLRKNINGFNNAAKGIPFLVLTDCDKFPCPSALVEDWLTSPKRPNLLLRVAKREVEAWLLADKSNIATFLGVRPELIPDDVESLDDPKRHLVRLACRSTKREIRIDVCPARNSTSQVGPNYNGRISQFVVENWDPAVASGLSPSLQRTIERLRDFQPVWNVQDAN